MQRKASGKAESSAGATATEDKPTQPRRAPRPKRTLLISVLRMYVAADIPKALRAACSLSTVPLALVQPLSELRWRDLWVRLCLLRGVGRPRLERACSQLLTSLLRLCCRLRAIAFLLIITLAAAIVVVIDIVVLAVYSWWGDPTRFLFHK